MADLLFEIWLRLLTNSNNNLLPSSFFFSYQKCFTWEEGKENFVSGSIARAQRRRIGFDQLTEKRPMTEKKIGFGRMSRFCDNSISFLISCCFDNSEKDRFRFRWQPWHWTGDFAPSFLFTNFTEKIFSWLRHSLSSEEKIWVNNFHFLVFIINTLLCNNKYGCYTHAHTPTRSRQWGLHTCLIPCLFPLCKGHVTRHPRSQGTLGASCLRC